MQFSALLPLTVKKAVMQVLSTKWSVHLRPKSHVGSANVSTHHCFRSSVTYNIVGKSENRKDNYWRMLGIQNCITHIEKELCLGFCYPSGLQFHL